MLYGSLGLIYELYTIVVVILMNYPLKEDTSSSSIANNNDAIMTSQSQTNKPILGYWNIRGLASSIRYQLIYSGIEFDEEVYDQGDAPEYSRDKWLTTKYKLGLEYPNLPYLKDGNDYKLTESGAIHRYCARKWCPELLCYNDEELYGKAEMVWGVVSDLKGFVTMNCYRGDGDKKSLSNAAIPRFALVAKQLESNKYLIGDKLCCADFALMELIEMMEFISNGEIYKMYPSLQYYRNRMFSLPKVKEYYEDERSDKAQKLQFNNKSAKINN